MKTLKLTDDEYNLIIKRREEMAELKRQTDFQKRCLELAIQWLEEQQDSKAVFTISEFEKLSDFEYEELGVYFHTVKNLLDCLSKSKPPTQFI